MTLSDLERRDARSHIFQADLLNNARTVWPRMTKFGRITRMREWRRPISRGSDTPCTARVWGSSAPQFSGVPFYSCIHSLTQNYQIWPGNTYGEGAIFRGSTTLPLQGYGSQRSPNFGGFLSIYVHLLTQNCQIWRGITRGPGRGAYLGVSHASHPKRGVPSPPTFWGSPVFMTTPFEAERPNSAWYR